jgi:hypothetical protein
MPKTRRRHVPTMDPHDPRNWRLVCEACGLELPPEVTIKVMRDHTVEQHPEYEGTPHFLTEWRGVGPKPRSRR